MEDQPKPPHRSYQYGMLKAFLLGNSQDLHTNRWRITCPCRHSWEPRTTMMSTQDLVCPKCRKEFIIDYNNLEEA